MSIIVMIDSTVVLKKKSLPALTLVFYLASPLVPAQAQDFLDFFMPHPLPPQYEPPPPSLPMRRQPKTPVQKAPEIKQPFWGDQPREYIETFAQVAPFNPDALSRKPSPHTGSWSSWEGDKIVGDSGEYDSARACYDGLLSLNSDIQHPIEITCEGSNEKRVLYLSCKFIPGQTARACFQKRTEAPQAEKRRHPNGLYRDQYHRPIPYEPW